MEKVESLDSFLQKIGIKTNKNNVELAKNIVYFLHLLPESTKIDCGSFAVCSYGDGLLFVQHETDNIND